MIALSRPLLAGACLLFVLMSGLDASGQILDSTVIQAKVIDADARQKIQTYIAPPMSQLTAADPDLKAVSEARAKLVRVLDDINATPEFQDAISIMIAGQIDKALVSGKSELVRMNAMIVISRLTDDAPNGSKALIAAGLVDKSDAVQRWAMEALRRRAARAKAANDTDELGKLFKTIIDKLTEQDPPHPIVVTPGVKALLTIDTPASRKAVADLLISRRPLHAADPKLSYAAEQVGYQVLAPSIVTAVPFDLKSGTALSASAFRYASIILGQFKSLDEDEISDSAADMLYQCTVSIAQITAGAGKQVPDGQTAAANAIGNGRWDDVQGLLDQWAVKLKAEPFNLTDEDLGL